MLDALMLPLRGVQLLFDIIALGLIGYVVDISIYSHSRVGFFLFVAIWTLFALAVLVALPRFLPRAAHPIVLLAIEAVTMIFWFAAFIALAVWISDVQDVFCDNSCRVVRAAVAFGAFEWLLWTATTALTALGFFRSRGSTSKPAGGAGPTVSV